MSDIRDIHIPYTQQTQKCMHAQETVFILHELACRSVLLVKSTILSMLEGSGVEVYSPTHIALGNRMLSSASFQREPLELLHWKEKKKLHKTSLLLPFEAAL